MRVEHRTYPDDLADVADALSDVRERLASIADRPRANASSTTEAEPLGVRAARLYRARRRRDQMFGADADLFGEPTWDILLDLYIAHVKRRRISVSSACIAASVPATTALRNIVILERRDLIVRTPDQVDRRRSWIALTDRGTRLIERYLSQPGV